MAASLVNYISIINHKEKAVKFALFIFVPGLKEQCNGKGKEYRRAYTTG